MKGIVTYAGIFFFTAWKSTYPKETKMIGYKILQAMPKTHPGGAKNGFSIVWYQVSVFSIFLV